MANVASIHQNKSPLQILSLALANQFVERQEAIQAMLIAVLACEHVYLLGPPGTAKSALIRAIAEALGRSNFEWLMTLFTTPDELFGPVKLSAMKNDSYERAITGKLPMAEFVFLDEIFKANSAIINSLLTAMNERKYHNGLAPIKMPLMSLFGASNELPQDESLVALRDRFLITVYVEPISERDNFKLMMRAGDFQPINSGIDIVHEQKQVTLVNLTPETDEAFADLWAACKANGRHVSDRRFRKSQKLVQAYAHLEGRTITIPDDLTIMEHVLWNEPSERTEVARLVQTVINPNAAKAVKCVDDARDLRKRIPVTVPKQGDPTRKDYLATCSESNANIAEILEKINLLGKGKKIDSARIEVQKIQAEIDTLSMQAMRGK